jgi:exodeoxyribonuclease-5
MNDFTPTQGQQEAIDMVGRFLKQTEWRFGRITGYAGTGKTTLIRTLSDRCGSPTILTPTGKAALRVGEATGLFAQTIHRFLYEPSEDPKTGRPIFNIKPEWSDSMLDMEGKLVIVDEGSMVDKIVWRDLQLVAKNVGFHILVMGDLFQLPPVYKDEEGRAFSTLLLETPFSVNLTEVIRQALDSPIIRASMVLRSGKPEYEALEMLEALGESRMISTIVEMRERNGVALCFTNKTRHDLNDKVRTALSYEPTTLHQDEPLLVTQNSYDLNCWNGEVVTFDGWEEDPGAHVVVSDRFTNSAMRVRYGLGNVAGQQAIMSPEVITGAVEAAKISTGFIKKAARRQYKDNHHSEYAPPYLDCNYGYALTCHKAQGSEWPEVLVVLEGRLSALRGIEKKRWLYTAITRAKHTVRYVCTDD